MIRPSGFLGAAFGTAADGDGRDDAPARLAISRELGIPSEWASLRQVHGDGVIEATAPGLLGDGDATFSTVPRLPMTIATADCYPVVLEADGAAGIAHAGWRGTEAAVVVTLRDAMTARGFEVTRAAIGPGIGPCCFEVGAEVAEHFPGLVSATTWGTTSVDLVAAILRQLEGIEVWRAETCTHCAEGYRSYRRDGTALRQVGVAWVA